MAENPPVIPLGRDDVVDEHVGHDSETSASATENPLGILVECDEVVEEVTGYDADGNVGGRAGQNRNSPSSSFVGVVTTEVFVRDALNRIG